MGTASEPTDATTRLALATFSQAELWAGARRKKGSAEFPQVTSGDCPARRALWCGYESSMACRRRSRKLFSAVLALRAIAASYEAQAIVGHGDFLLGLLGREHVRGLPVSMVARAFPS